MAGRHGRPRRAESAAAAGQGAEQGMTAEYVTYTSSNFASADSREQPASPESRVDAAQTPVPTPRTLAYSVSPSMRVGGVRKTAAQAKPAAGTPARPSGVHIQAHITPHAPAGEIHDSAPAAQQTPADTRPEEADDPFPSFLLPGGADTATPLPDPERRVGRGLAWSAFAAVAMVFLVAGWLVGIDGTSPAATITNGTERPLAEIELPALDRETAMQLGDVEYRLTRRQHARYIRVQEGDTFIGVLTRAGASQEQARAAVSSLAGIFDPRSLRPGRRIAVLFGVREGRQGTFVGMRFDSSFDRVVSVQRQANDGFIATELRKQLTTEMVRGDGEIRASLFQAGLRNQVPAAAMIRMIHLLSYDVDFQRDIQPGDRFQIMYMRHRGQDGTVVRNGEVVYLALTLRGVTQRLYRYTTPSGRTDYFDEQGRGLRKALMRTPIDGARLSSNFGRRRHPILGYTRMHAGVDFAAPTGTPIYAAGDGTIDYAGRRGGYGNYIRINHTRDYQTAYAHMHRFADGMRRGARVRQGQVIGYVGTTGRSTGPHLHYEVIHNGERINPMTLRLPSNQRLEGEDLERFLAYRAEMDERFADLGQSGGTEVIADRSEAELSICINGRRLDPTDGRACPDGQTAGETEGAEDETQTIVTTRGN